MRDDADGMASWAWFCEALFYETAERKLDEEMGLLEADDESFDDERVVGDASDDLVLMAQTLSALGETIAAHSDLAEDLVVAMCVAERLPRALPELVHQLEPRIRAHWDRLSDDPPPIDLQQDDVDDLDAFDDDELLWDEAKERAGEELSWTEELRPLLSLALTHAPPHAPSADDLAALVEGLAEVMPLDADLGIEQGPEHVRASVAGTSIHLTLPPRQDDARDRLRATFRALIGYRDALQVLFDAASPDTDTHLIVAAPIQAAPRSLHLLAGPAVAFARAEESEVVEVLDRHLSSPPPRESMEPLARALAEHGWLEIDDADVAAIAVEIERAYVGDDGATRAYMALMNDARVRELWLGVEDLEHILERW